MEKGFHNIEQFIAFITPGHTAFHERLSIGNIVGLTQESFPHIKINLHLPKRASIELLDAEIQGTALLHRQSLAVFHQAIIVLPSNSLWRKDFHK